jgi:hypothetical protein
MATTKKTGDGDVKAEPVEAKAALGGAGASTDPHVHQVLAELEIAQRNDDKQTAAALEARLTELGVEL